MSPLKELRLQETRLFLRELGWNYWIIYRVHNGSFARGMWFREGVPWLEFLNYGGWVSIVSHASCASGDGLNDDDDCQSRWRVSKHLEEWYAW